MHIRTPLKGFLEKFLKIKFPLKSIGESLLSLEKFSNFSIVCKTTPTLLIKIFYLFSTTGFSIYED